MISLNGDLGKGEIWLELDEWLKREFVTEDARRLRLGAVCIDSGGHHTQEVYRFCNMRLGRHIYAIKGMDGARPIWPRRAGKSRKLPGSNVWTIGVDTAKDAIYSKLKVATPGPGYCHFPIAYQQEFVNQLISEEVRTRFVCGHPVPYLFTFSGKKRGLDGHRLRVRCAARAPGSVGSAAAHRPDRASAPATAQRRGPPVEHDTIRQTYEPLHKNAPDSEGRKRIEQEAKTKAEEALAKQGLTPETYTHILNAVNADDELRKRALELIDEKRRRSWLKGIPFYLPGNLERTINHGDEIMKNLWSF